MVHISCFKKAFLSSLVEYSNSLRIRILCFHELYAIIKNIKINKHLKYVTLCEMNVYIIQVSFFEWNY